MKNLHLYKTFMPKGTLTSILKKKSIMPRNYVFNIQTFGSFMFFSQFFMFSEKEKGIRLFPDPIDNKGINQDTDCPS